MATRPVSSPTDMFFQKFDEELKDPVNFELMVDAVALPCQHRVNEDTALQILSLEQQTAHTCPTCRAPFVNYVIDTTMRSLARMRQSLQQGELPANASVERTAPTPAGTTTAALQRAGSSAQSARVAALPMAYPVPPASGISEPVNPLYVPISFNVGDVAPTADRSNRGLGGLPGNTNRVPATSMEHGRLPTYTENVKASAGSMIDWLHLKIVGY